MAKPNLTNNKFKVIHFFSTTSFLLNGFKYNHGSADSIQNMSMHHYILTSDFSYR